MNRAGSPLLADLIGAVLDGKYRIEEKLGQGGMGTVYRATHLGTKRNVALKIIMPQLTVNAEFLERFKREAEATGRLQHPNVVNVTDFGFTSCGGDNIAYLVMEYLDGQTLGDLMTEKGRLPLGFVVDIVEQICLALDKAHRQGIIHRDLKPDNIWLEPNSRGGYNVKILDFGLAKLRDTQPEAAIESVDNRISISDEADTLIQQSNNLSGSDHELTRVGAILGTPLYISPEQCQGSRLSPSTDIYSLGVVVYEMLAGEPPFSGDLHTLIVKHRETPPPSLREKRPEIPVEVAELIMSALEKNPPKRPISARIFAGALRAHAEGIGVAIRRALALFSEHMPVLIRLSLFANLFPLIIGLSCCVVIFFLKVFLW